LLSGQPSNFFALELEFTQNSFPFSDSPCPPLFENEYVLCLPHQIRLAFLLDKYDTSGETRLLSAAARTLFAHGVIFSVLIERIHLFYCLVSTLFH
jgi:hypothetical protein